MTFKERLLHTFSSKRLLPSGEQSEKLKFNNKVSRKNVLHVGVELDRLAAM